MQSVRHPLVCSVLCAVCCDPSQLLSSPRHLSAPHTVVCRYCSLGSSTASLAVHSIRSCSGASHSSQSLSSVPAWFAVDRLPSHSSMSGTAVWRRCVALVRRQGVCSRMQCNTANSKSLSSALLPQPRSSARFHSLATSSTNCSAALPLPLLASSYQPHYAPSAAAVMTTSASATAPPHTAPSSHQSVPWLLSLVCPASPVVPLPEPLLCMNRNKRRIGKANHGARPCNSVGRKQRTLNNKQGWRQLGLRPGQTRPALKGAGTPAVYAETNQ